MASNFMNSVYYSSDGVSWIAATNTIPWMTRSNSAGIVFNNKMWLMGGKSTGGSLLNDVWSSTDGISWTRETENAQWSARRSFGCFTLPGKNKMYIVGGADASGNGLADVWSSPDGKTWTQEKVQAFQKGRSAFGIVTYNNAVWILGGIVSGDTRPVNEVWSSADGLSWNIQNTAKWKARSYPVVGALSNGIYLSGGMDADEKGIYDMNKMSADGKWTQQQGPPFAEMTSPAGVEYQDALWFIGGAGKTKQSPNRNVWAYAPSVRG